MSRIPFRRRYYTVTMSNGDIYRIPAEIIAENYAKHYSSQGDDYAECYNAMIDWFDEGEIEFADWAKNNMDWEDVKDCAVLLERNGSGVDYQDGWVNGEYKYIYI